MLCWLNIYYHNYFLQYVWIIMLLNPGLNKNKSLYFIRLEVTGDPQDLIGSQQCDLFMKYYFLL